MACPYPSALILSLRTKFISLVIFLLLLMCPRFIQAQTATYYLHKEAASGSLLQLKTAAPDAAASAFLSAELRNQPNGDYLIRAFETATNVPNAPGVIPAFTPIRFKLWMRKTDPVGSMQARVKLHLNNAAGTMIMNCSGIDAAFGPLTTSVTDYVFTCFTPSEVTMLATDRFYLWVGVTVSGVGNNRVKAELSVEQNRDSNVLMPVAIPRPTISNLSPNSGPVETPVVVTGSNFGVTQGSREISFNGVMGSPSTWSDTRIDVPVPLGATTGPVVVTAKSVVGDDIKSVVGNAVNYTVSSGGVVGTINAATVGAPIGGALVEAHQSLGLVTGARTNSNGSYSFSGLKPGTYDIWISADGYATEVRPGIVASTGSLTTLNVSLYRSGAISGTVKNTDGITPIAGATIKVLQGASFSKSVSNSTGNYTVDGLRPGTFTVQASAAGYTTNLVTGVMVSEQATTTSDFNLISHDPTDAIKYNYDEVGRLVTVEDKVREVAKYSYDPVGNLLSITRHNPTQVSILEFTPESGSGGTSVTIYGTGFSSVLSENSVTFNGTAGTVTSATATQIVASTPSNVNTGPIAVTTPTGSATSSTPFTLDTYGPTITGFTPPIADEGTNLTITGTNFDPVTHRNGLSVGLWRLPIISGSTTQLIVTIPFRAASGRVTVTTPFGTAVSANDFFYPSSGAAAEVEYMGRMEIGETKTVTINNANKSGLLLFDSVAGRRIGYLVNNTLMPSLFLSYAIYNPDGSKLRDFTSVNSNSTSFVDNYRSTTIAGNNFQSGVPLTGTYAIYFSPLSQPGTFSVTLSDIPADFGTTIAPGGPTKTVNITSPGQNARLTFTGIAKQRLSLWMTNAQFFGSVNVFDSNGVIIPNLDNYTLPSSGVYTIVVDPSGAETGTANLTLYDVPSDFSGTVTINGAPVTVTTTVPGQNANLTFSGTSGQLVTVRVTNNTMTPFPQALSVALINPDGTVLTSFNGGANFDLSQKTLPAPGTYRISINPSGPGTGNATISVTSP
jgi:YD repeat-containing protein